MARGRRSSGTARLLVLVGILTVLGVTFGAGVYAGRISSARSAVVAARVAETEPARRGPGRGLKAPEAPAPRLTFYQELTAPLTAPPPPPKPAKTSPPPLATVPPHPGEQSEALAGRDGATRVSNRPPAERTEHAAPATTNPATTTPGRFTVQVASYRVRPPADALRESLASAGHDARVVEADANGPVYRVQIGEFATREAARALAARLAGERSSVAPFVTTR